jgi:hypothetical protein
MGTCLYKLLSSLKKIFLKVCDPCGIAAIRYKLAASMNLKDWALVPPLMLKAYMKTFRSGRKYRRTYLITDAKERKLAQRKVAMAWGHSLLQELHVEAVNAGVPPVTDKPCIFVGNHMSYVDIILLNALHPVNFVAKAVLQ